MKKLFIAISALLAVSALQAKDATESIVDEILSNNPDMSAQMASLSAQMAATRAENNLSDPEVEFERNYAARRGVDDKWALSVSQSFDWPGAYRARSRAIKSGNEALMKMQKASLLDKALEIRQLLLDWSLAKRRLDLLSEIKANVDSLAAATSMAFDYGEATILDVKKLKLQTFALDEQVGSAQAAVDAVRAELVALNGGKTLNLDVIDLNTPVAPLASETVYLDAFYSGDPMLEANEAGRLAAQGRVSVAKAASFPGLSVGYVHSYEEGTHFNGFSVGLSLPVFSWRNRRAAAEAEVMNARFVAVDYEMKARADVIATYSRARSLKRQLDYYRDTFADADYLRLLGRALEGGQVSLIDYLTEINFYIETMGEYLSVEYGYRSALVRLNRYSVGHL